MLFVCTCGILLISATVVFFLWNEGRAVRRSQLLNEAFSKCRPLSNIEQVFDSNNGHLVHLTGPLTTDEPLEDSQYGVIVSAARLRRTVEMYQWMEYTRTQGRNNRVTYHYIRAWIPELVPSVLFSNSRGYHRNPTSFPVNQMEWKAQQTTVGSFYLSPALVDLISDWKPIQLSLTREMKQQKFKIYDNHIYYSYKPWHPHVGDIRIRYDFAGMSDSANPSHVSIIACQSSGGELTTYYSAELGEELLLLHSGVKSYEEMLNKANRSNVIRTWLCRGIGWCTSFIGFLILTLGGCLENFQMMRDMVNSELLIANVLLASSVTLVSVAIGWLGWRPLITMASFSSATIPYMVVK